MIGIPVRTEGFKSFFQYQYYIYTTLLTKELKMNLYFETFRIQIYDFCLQSYQQMIRAQMFVSHLDFIGSVGNLKQSSTLTPDASINVFARSGYGCSINQICTYNTWGWTQFHTFNFYNKTLTLGGSQHNLNF